MSDLVTNFARQLRDYAEHFEQRDWNYTRESDIKHIRYEGDWSGYDHPVRRLGRALRHLFGPTDSLSKMLGMEGPRSRIGMARHYLRTDPHHPDGVLDGGSIITHWEETGEYLQYVQPSVGSLLADLMEAHPDLPEVVSIAEEMKRINDAYGERIAASQVEPEGNAR